MLMKSPRLGFYESTAANAALTVILEREGIVFLSLPAFDAANAQSHSRSTLRRDGFVFHPAAK